MEQIRTNADVLVKKNIINRISDVPGGISLVLSTLVAGNIVPEGTPLSAPVDGKRTVCKQAEILAGSTTTAIQIPEGSHFKVGNFIGIEEADAAYAITDISNAAGVDTLTVGTAIGTPVTGKHIYEMDAESASACVFKNIPDTILKEAFEVPSTTQVIFFGDALVRADVAEGAIGDEYLAGLKAIEVIKY